VELWYASCSSSDREVFVSFRTATSSGKSGRQGEANRGSWPIRAALERLLPCTIGLLLVVAVPCLCRAQGKTSSAASTAGGSSVAGATSSPTADPKTQTKSPYITAADGAPVDEVNRKALEERAGLDGGKLLLRSVPSQARVFVDGDYVGHTPLLLIVAPGKYKIQMQGPGEESGEKTVGLSPKETREVVLALTARYPNHVAAR
jgi:PEGA domain